MNVHQVLEDVQVVTLNKCNARYGNVWKGFRKWLCDNCTIGKST